jgi:parvulin-like peptidyl-prolyl isomerase
MAKRRIKKEVPLTRKQVSRRDKERRQRLILIGVAAAIGSLILAVLGYGAYQELIAKPAAPVAIVNGVPITTETYQKIVLLERMNIDASMQNLFAQRSQYDPEEDAFLLTIIDQQLSQLSMQRELLSSQTALDSLIEEELIGQAAEERGIVVSPDEIDRQIEQDFGYVRDQPTPLPSPSTGAITPTVEITPTEAPPPMTRAEFEELYSNSLGILQEGAGLTEGDYRELVKASLLREKMEELIGQQVPTTEPHILARHILLDTEEEAQDALRRLEQGEDFAALATEVSTDTVSAELGGDLGWLPQGSMVAEFEEVAFDLPLGEISEVVKTPYGFHIILVEERDEDRELDPEILDQRKRDAFDIWLADLLSEAVIERYWSEDKAPPE